MGIGTVLKKEKDGTGDSPSSGSQKLRTTLIGVIEDNIVTTGKIEEAQIDADQTDIEVAALLRTIGRLKEVVPSLALSDTHKGLMEFAFEGIERNAEEISRNQILSRNSGLEAKKILMEESEVLREDLEVLEAEIETLETDAAQTAEEIAALQAEVAEREARDEAKREKIRKALEGNRFTADNLTAVIEGQKKNIEDCRRKGKDTKAIEAMVDGLIKNRAAYRDRIEDLEKQLAAI